MLERLRGDAAWRVEALVTTLNESNGRVAMHGTPQVLIRAQADSLGLPLTTIGLSEGCDNAEYEQRLAEGLTPYRQQGISHVACGDLFLDDIRQWREALFERIGWQGIFPLWKESTDRLSRYLIEQSWALTVTCVDLEKLSDRFLGRPYDQAFIDDLPETVDPCGENGEFHTFVHDGPGFVRPVEFSTGRTVVTHGRFAMLELCQSMQT